MIIAFPFTFMKGIKIFILNTKPPEVNRDLGGLGVYCGVRKSSPPSNAHHLIKDEAEVASKDNPRAFV